LLGREKKDIFAEVLELLGRNLSSVGDFEMYKEAYYNF